jgi:hypothetical protein
MKTISKILIAVAIIIAIPFIVGFCLPKERIVVRMTMIDQSYYMILADISNHWEEPAWRPNIDTLIQKESIDGQDCWMEYYTNGDSVKLITQRLGENDYVRLIVKPDGRELNRSITLADVNGKTAIRISEEVYEPNPVKRFLNLFNDTEAARIEQYLLDLKTKNKPATDAVPVE